MMEDDLTVVDQPRIPPGRTKGTTTFHAGSKRSVAVLERLQFDPITELVNKYRKLEEELAIQEQWRAGEIVFLNLQGKPKAYVQEVHLAIYDRLIAVADKLLRYGYGRVPETLHIDDKKPKPLIVNLTRKGDVYQVGGLDDDESLGDNND